MTRRAHRSTDAVEIAWLTAAVGGIDSDEGPPLGDSAVERCGGGLHLGL